MRDAHRRKDLSYLEAVVADDFTIIHANGDLLTKEEWFADLRSGATGWERLDVNNIVAKVFDDVAVVHNRQHVQGRLRGTPFETRTRSTNTLVRKGRRWHFLNIHVTGDLLRSVPTLCRL